MFAEINWQSYYTPITVSAVYWGSMVSCIKLIKTHKTPLRGLKFHIYQIIHELFFKINIPFLK